MKSNSQLPAKLLFKMVLKTFATFTLLLISSTHFSSAATDKVFCYYKSWTDQTVFATEDIDVDICTHVSFAFMRLNEDGSFRFDDGGGDESVLEKFSGLKSKNPDVKLLITVGGWTEDAVPYSDVAADDHKKENFATTLLRYMQNYNLDGIDIDWEFPTEDGERPEDRANLLDLINVTRSALDYYGGGVITVTGSPNPDPKIYDVQGISKLVDGINLLTYDFHGYATDTVTGENSPLYSNSADTDTNANCDAAINSWLNSGADPTKLILGLAFYGHMFQLVDPDQHVVGSPADGATEDYTGYDELCVQTNGWSEDWDDEGEVPYRYSENQWITYDNARSIGLKVQYAKERNLGGVMMWSVNDDDNKGICGDKNPLLLAIKNNL